MNRCQRLRARPEHAKCSVEICLELLLREAPRVVRRPHQPGIGAAQDERSGPVRVGRCEEHTHGRALGQPEQGRPTGPDGIHHRPQVIHPRFQRGNSADAVGHARAALVEADLAAPRAHVFQPRREGPQPPLRLEVRDMARSEYDIERPSPRDLVGDVHVTAAGVVRLRSVHPAPPRAQPRRWAPEWSTMQIVWSPRRGRAIMSA